MACYCYLPIPHQLPSLFFAFVRISSKNLLFYPKNLLSLNQLLQSLGLGLQFSLFVSIHTGLLPLPGPDPEDSFTFVWCYSYLVKFCRAKIFNYPNCWKASETSSCYRGFSRYLLINKRNGFSNCSSVHTFSLHSHECKQISF